MGIYWGALTIFEQLSNSNNGTTLTGSVNLLELWLLSGGDKKEGTLEFPSRGLGILLEMGHNEVAVVDERDMVREVFGCFRFPASSFLANS